MLLIGNGCFGELSILLRVIMVCVFLYIAILIVYHTTGMTHIKIRRVFLRIENCLEQI